MASGCAFLDSQHRVQKENAPATFSLKDCRQTVNIGTNSRAISL